MNIVNIGIKTGESGYMVVPKLVSNNDECVPGYTIHADGSESRAIPYRIIHGDQTVTNGTVVAVTDRDNKTTITYK